MMTTTQPLIPEQTPTDSGALASQSDSLVEILVVVESTLESFRALEKDSVEEGLLRRDFGDLSRHLAEFQDDLLERTEYFRELDEKIQSRSERTDFFSSLTTDSTLLSKLKAQLIQAKQRVLAVESLTESVFKITSMRRVLGKVEHLLTRKTLAQALSNASVTIDRVRGFRDGLADVLGDLAEKGLDARLGIIDIADVRLPSTKGFVRREREKSLPGCEPSGRDTKSRSRGRSGPLGRKRSRGAKDAEGAAGRTGGNEAVLSAEEFRAARDALSCWSKRQPFVPSNLGNVVSFVSITKEPSVKIKVKLLWGARRRVKRCVPFREPSEKATPVTCLWDLPATPPETFEPVTQLEHLLGEETVRECEQCDTSGQIDCQKCDAAGQLPCPECSGQGSCESCEAGVIDCQCRAGQTKCPMCQGETRLVEYQSCETRYELTELSTTDYRGQLPAELLEEAHGELTQESFDAVKSNFAKAGLHRVCLDVVKDRVHKDFLKETLEPLFRPPEELVSGSRDGDGDVRLIRAQIESYHEPVIAVTCSLRSPNHPNVGDRFQVWLYGTQRKIYVRGLPRVWTQKATSWIGGLAVAGAVVGFLAGKLLQWVL